MPISVDELSISIEAKAQSANTAIDRLVDKLDRLSGSLGRLNTSNLNTLAMGVNRLGTAMQTMNGVKTADFTRLAKNLERLNLIDVSNLSSISASVNHMATAFKGLENISQTAGQLGELANGIRQLGYKSADKAIENIPKLAVAMKDLMKTLSGAPKVSQNLIEMTNALAKLARTGASSGKAATSLSRSLNTYTKSTTKATSGTKGLASAIGKLYATYWLLFRAFGKLGDAIDISSKLTEVQNVVDVTFGKYADMVERMSDTSITDFGMSELTVKQVASRFQAMGTAMGFAQGQMADMSIELTKLTADMASFYNMNQEDVAKDLESVFTGMTRPLRTYGLDLTQATLQEWALRNGMNANIDAMSQMEKTMLRYQYVMANTGAAQGDFARTVNTWANQTRILKQNLEALASVIGGALINALKPLVRALNAAMSHIIAFAETISNALGKIFGWKYEKSGGGIAQDFDDAAIGAEDIADSTGTAAKNIDKMKAGLRAFDELKTINLPEATDPTGGGGAGAGGSGDGAIAAGGQWVKVDSLFDKYKSEIDTLYKLGSYISKTLIDAMESIDWNAIYEKARGFGKGLADFLNGLFADQNGITLFGEIGKTIAKALNTVIYSALSFGETFDFEQFGRNIADGINNFFQNFDFGALANTIDTWVQGIWKTIKTAIVNINWRNVFKGLLDFIDEIDLETIFLLAIPNAKKLSKLVNTLSVKFKSVAKYAKAFIGTFTGNGDALATLIARFPKLGKTVDVLGDSFQRFMFGLHYGDIFGGLNSAITNIRNNLTGMQKGIIGVVSVFAEFKLLKDSFYDIASGADNLVASIGKIAAGAGLASTALYTAFGPAGLAIAGITAVISAISGINKAFDDIRAAEIGESIKNALSNPGGTPLGEITSQFADAIGKIGESFTVITEKASGLKQADEHIKDTWLEIEKIETAMDAGVISVEEGTAELTRLFGELAQTASEKFTALENTLLTAFGENGVLSNVFQRLGISTENTTTTILQLNDKVQKRIEELTSLLAQTDPSNPNYATYKEELAGLMTQTDELTQAISNYDFALKNIDYSDLILPDGTLDTSALQDFLNELKNATETANEDIENAVNSTRETLEQEKTLAESVGDWVAAEEIQAKIDALPQALELLKGDVELKAVELTDTIQNDFIGSLDNIIEDAQNRWGEKGFWGQTWNGVFGAGTEDEFVKEAVDKQVKNIEDLSDAIQDEFKNLEVESPAWAKEAMDALYTSLFDTEYRFSDMGGGKTVYSLNENFKDLINGATEGISELAAERGKDATDGYANGFSNSENLQNAQNSAKTFTEKVLDTIAETQDSHSPSKVTESLGKDAVDGYNLGISENTESTKNTVSTYMTSVIDKFNSFQSEFVDIGKQIMSGLMDGMSNMEKPLYDKVNGIADNITQTVQKALDIHSPSRVMFALGDYTMQGFKLGMENLYQPIYSSMQKFGKDLQLAPVPTIESMYSGIGYNQVSSYNAPAYEPLSNVAGTYNQSNAETNALLRELLAAVKQGQKIEVNGRELGRTVRNEANDYFRRTGTPYFAF